MLMWAAKAASVHYCTANAKHRDLRYRPGLMACAFQTVSHLVSTAMQHDDTAKVPCKAES